MDIISRQDAIALGKSYYFTGKPCKYGHIAKRHVTGCVCEECLKIFASKPESKRKRKEYNQTQKQKEKSCLSAAKYHKNNREECLRKMKARNKIYYKLNKERIKKHVLDYQAKNAAERTKYKNEWAKKKAKSDPVFKMSLVCRRMLQRALGVAGQVKYKRTQDYLPYTYTQLVQRLESQFSEGMSWENYGKWHIDHITPLSYFIKKGVIDPAIINSLDNLQPLWASDNMAKGDKITQPKEYTNHGNTTK